MPLQVVLVTEATPPDGREAVAWVLLTTRPITMLADAIQVGQWYRLRRLIERDHFPLNSGCWVEHVQLETAAARERALATEW